MKKIIGVLLVSAVLTGCCGCNNHKRHKSAHHHKTCGHVTEQMKHEHCGK